MESLPQVLSSTQRLCGFLNLASTLAGMNMDAIVRLGHILKDMAAAGPNGIACAKFVAFCNAPEDNPFYGRGLPRRGRGRRGPERGHQRAGRGAGGGGQAPPTPTSPS